MRYISRRLLLIPLLIIFQLTLLFADEGSNLLDVMKKELDRSMKNLENASEIPMYYLQYSVVDRHYYLANVSNGGMLAPESTHNRYLDVDLRVGSMELDNTHEIRGGNWWDNYTPRRIVDFPLNADEDAIRAVLWNETEYQFSQAQERFTKVQTNRQVKVEEEDLSNDFSAQKQSQFTENAVLTKLEADYWNTLLNEAADYFMRFPFIKTSYARLHITEVTRFMVNNGGARLQHSNCYIGLRFSVSGMAEDGMDLDRTVQFTAATLGNLPDKATVMQAVERIVSELEALVAAPLVDPYIGPAILRNRASGVFFHEIFGHRIEGHRQKRSQEGQTFTKRFGEVVLPEFISIYDDPTMKQLNGIDLRGYYKFDDEGTPAQRVTVVEKGVLKNFLTSRSPIENGPKSNGHGRREYGRDVVSRQGNLTIKSDKVVTYDKLRQMLIEECKRQEKPYGLIFDDISGGFTMTGRRGPQAFKVKPLLVYRVYADGRQDEVVRGVDIVGTPLTSFSKILVTADDDDVFNGTCGAESGQVPVSAISPSILVSEIEIEKRRKGQEKPPILPPPGHEK